MTSDWKRESLWIRYSLSPSLSVGNEIFSFFRSCIEFYHSTRRTPECGECLSTSLPLPTLPHARYSVNLQKKSLHILIFICILITTYANQTPLCGFKKNTEKNGVPFSLCSELAQFRLRKQLTRNRYSKIWRLNREILHLDIWQRYTIF